MQPNFNAETTTTTKGKANQTYCDTKELHYKICLQLAQWKKDSKQKQV